MAERKRILILIPRMGGGGTERVVSILANNLCKTYCIRIATLVSRGEFYKLDPQIEVVTAGYNILQGSTLSRYFSMGYRFLNAILYVRKQIKLFQPDIVFSLLEEMDIVSYLALKGLKGIRIIHSERNDPTARNKHLQRILEKIYQKTDMLVCQSRTVSDYYRNVKHKTVIPNPIDFSIYPDTPPEGKPERIVAVGRLREQKNFLMLEKAFARIADQYQDVTVTIYGEGPQRQLIENAIEQDGLKDRFILHGASKDVLNEIKDAAIFAFPTNYEGFPNALVEAIALGIPVVSTDFATGVAREVVNEKAGIVVPVGDVDAFANGLKELLDHPEKRDYIRNHSREVLEPFAIGKVVALWERSFKCIGE